MIQLPSTTSVRLALLAGLLMPLAVFTPWPVAFSAAATLQDTPVAPKPTNLSFPVLISGQKIDGDFRNPEANQPEFGRRCFLINTQKGEFWEIGVSQGFTLGFQPKFVDIDVSAATKCDGKGYLLGEIKSPAASRTKPKGKMKIGFPLNSMIGKQYFRFVAGGGQYILVIGGMEPTGKIGKDFRDYRIEANMTGITTTRPPAPTQAEYASMAPAAALAQSAGAPPATAAAQVPIQADATATASAQAAGTPFTLGRRAPAIPQPTANPVAIAGLQPELGQSTPKPFPVLLNGQPTTGDFREPQAGQMPGSLRCFVLNTQKGDIWNIEVSQRDTIGFSPTALPMDVSVAGDCSGNATLLGGQPSSVASKTGPQYRRKGGALSYVNLLFQTYKLVAGGGPYLVILAGREGNDPVGSRYRDYTIVPTLTGRATSGAMAPTETEYAENVARQQAAAAAQKQIATVIAANANATASTADRTEPNRKAGAVFRDCADICPEMVVVPAGSFLMGSSASEEGRSANEGPQHRVTIRQPFAIGKFEITVAEWNACVAEAGCPGPAPGEARMPAQPISWDQARQYAAWLSLKTGQRYFVPSEAEWEYAARAGTSTAWNSGDAIITDDGNILDLFKQAVPVGGFPANGFGLHDMHGNVAEWTLDCIGVGYFGTPTDGSAALTPDCPTHVYRGGSWSSPPTSVRSAARATGEPGKIINGVGLRIARAL